jgi:hypothetical protein
LCRECTVCGFADHHFNFFYDIHTGWATKSSPGPWPGVNTEMNK